MLTILIAAVIAAYIFIPLTKAQRYLAALVIVALFNLLTYASVSRNYQLQNEGSHTVGQLIEKDCGAENRQKVKYRFTAAGRELVGQGRPGTGNPACEALHTGDPLYITYLPDTPEINVPEKAVDSWMKTGWVCSVILVFFLAWMNRVQTQFMQRRRALHTPHDADSSAQ